MNFDVFDFGHIKLLFEKLTLIEFDLYRQMYLLTFCRIVGSVFVKVGICNCFFYYQSKN